MRINAAAALRPPLDAGQLGQLGLGRDGVGFGRLRGAVAFPTSGPNGAGADAGPDDAHPDGSGAAGGRVPADQL